MTGHNLSAKKRKKSGNCDYRDGDYRDGDYRDGDY